MRARSSTVAAVCLVSAIGSAARADDAVRFELAGNAVIVQSGEAEGETTVKIGCTPRSFAATATAAYALCARNVVVIITATPKPHVEERRALAEPVISLTVQGGVLLVRSDAGLRPLSEYRIAVAGETAPAYEDWIATTPRRPPAKPAITGLELGALGTAGVGVDAIPGPFAYLDASIIERFAFGLSLAAYGTFGAATGGFQTGNRNTGPFGGDVQVVTGEALIGFDTRYFAFSLGAGAAMTDNGYDVEPLVAVRGRAGAVDGFTFSWHAAFVAGPNALGAIGGALELPVTRRLWFGVDAELGNLRYGRFMVDLRQRISPKLQRATLDLRASIGLAYVHSGAACQGSFTQSNVSGDTICEGTNADYLGPAVSLGLSWRP